MAKCYEIPKLEILERSVRDGVPDPWTTCDLVVLPDEAMAAMDAILVQFGSTAAEWCDRLNASLSNGMAMPWAVIALGREYHLAGHFSQIRGAPAEMRFSPYSDVPKDRPSDYVPPLGVILAASKAALKAASARSVLLESAWNTLAEKASNLHWLCMPEPPSDDWVRGHESGDDVLFQTTIQPKEV